MTNNATRARKQKQKKKDARMATNNTPLLVPDRNYVPVVVDNSSAAAEEATQVISPAKASPAAEEGPTRDDRPKMPLRKRHGATHPTRAFPTPALGEMQLSADKIEHDFVESKPGQNNKIEFGLGKKIQDEEDNILKHPRVVELLRKHTLELSALHANENYLQENFEKSTDEVFDLRHRLKESDAPNKSLSQADETISEAYARIEELESELTKEKDDFQDLKKVCDGFDKDNADILSELDDAVKSKQHAEAQKHALESFNQQLHQRVEDLEKELSSQQDTIDNNVRLESEIAEVHESFEQTFSEMSKGLTLQAKFDYVRRREQEIAATTTARPRIISGASLQGELDELSDTGSEHGDGTPEKPKEVLGFSKITSVETAPIDPPTKPTQKPAAEKPQALHFSGITTVETAPIAAPAPIIACPTIEVVEKAVHVPSVPWYVWLVLLLGLLGLFACVGIFAGLCRERQIWIDANELVHQRLMGAEQEGWKAWISMGLQDLSGMGGSGMSLFG